MRKYLFYFAALLLASACTTMRPVEVPAEDIAEQIANQQIVQVGDTVRLITSTGDDYTFEVTAITEESVVGESEEVALEEIVAIEKRDSDAGIDAAQATEVAGAAIEAGVTLYYIVGIVAGILVLTQL